MSGLATNRWGVAPDQDDDLLWESDIGFYRECNCGRLIFPNSNWRCSHCEGCPDCGGVYSNEDGATCLDCGKERDG